METAGKRLQGARCTFKQTLNMGEERGCLKRWQYSCFTSGKTNQQHCPRTPTMQKGASAWPLSLGKMQAKVGVQDPAAVIERATAGRHITHPALSDERSPYLGMLWRHVPGFRCLGTHSRHHGDAIMPHELNRAALTLTAFGKELPGDPRQMLDLFQSIMGKSVLRTDSVTVTTGLRAGPVILRAL